ncbi:LIM and senescent cell antigen-like-containing domain protein 1 [Oopsacas minuta]|uniref:LIM and senescent cell antigen-like-containing domain protein 1 n=1 Tax=Oopsacas minuta TaxID=111878 RepID=A0AAV7KHT1_9METZ|nr:LIM and senescent cell antigen-like-containing domain protein 1 [Oopsacas minuta]
MSIITDTARCSLCKEMFQASEKLINSGGEVWHEKCFVCVQCFQPFPDGLFYESDGRKYCEHDFQMLFSPVCHKCNKFISGRVIRAIGHPWHPDCFRCVWCDQSLADVGFVKFQGQPLCKACNTLVKQSGKHLCQICFKPIEDEPLFHMNMVVHPHHFNCFKCKKPLETMSKLHCGELVCIRCYDKMEASICVACRRPIEGRIVHANAQTWHPEHFVCAYCEKPFEGQKHYEKKGLAYCEPHYNQLYGEICFYCNNHVIKDVVNVLCKSWCVGHFRCTACDVLLALKGNSKFIFYDNRPLCRKCYDRLPQEFRRRLKRMDELKK